MKQSKMPLLLTVAFCTSPATIPVISSTFLHHLLPSSPRMTICWPWSRCGALFPGTLREVFSPLQTNLYNRLLWLRASWLCRSVWNPPCLWSLSVSTVATRRLCSVLSRHPSTDAFFRPNKQTCEWRGWKQPAPLFMILHPCVCMHVHEHRTRYPQTERPTHGQRKQEAS